MLQSEVSFMEHFWLHPVLSQFIEYLPNLVNELEEELKAFNPPSELLLGELKEEFETVIVTCIFTADSDLYLSEVFNQVWDDRDQIVRKVKTRVSRKWRSYRLFKELLFQAVSIARDRDPNTKESTIFMRSYELSRAIIAHLKTEAPYVEVKLSQKKLGEGCWHHMMALLVEYPSEALTSDIQILFGKTPKEIKALYENA